MTKTFQIVRTTTLALIACGCIAGATPAFAAEDQAPQAQLNTAGVDFTSAKAVNRLINRLHRIATDMCAPNHDAKTLMSDDERKCFDVAVQSGMTQIDSKRQEAMRGTPVHVAVAQSDVQPGQ